MIIAIQGGEGSFNEEATLGYLEREKLSDFQIIYAITSENVLNQVLSGEADLGIFAIFNDNSGIVEESVNAMSKYNFNLVTSFSLPIRQCLHVKAGTTVEKIERIVSHPQALLQCNDYLRMYFRNAEYVKGFDTATEVKNLMDGFYDNLETAVIAPKICEKKYGSKVIVEDVQNAKKNLTYFCVIKK